MTGNEEKVGFSFLEVVCVMKFGRIMRKAVFYRFLEHLRHVSKHFLLTAQRVDTVYSCVICTASCMEVYQGVSKRAIC